MSRIFFFSLLLIAGCTKQNRNPSVPPTPPVQNFSVLSVNLNGQQVTGTAYNIPVTATFKIKFSAPVNRSSVNTILFNSNGVAVPYSIGYENGDSTILLQLTTLLPITKYSLTISSSVLSKQNTSLQSAVNINLVTALAPTDKFPRISDDELLTLVQKQTFKYFWDFAHPVSGLARERNSSGDVVTSGGSGLGIMAIITGIERKFITRAEGLQRMQKIVGFLGNKAQKFHGAYPHWLNGATGAVVPFSTNDDGADLVETSFLIQGLITARQFFNGSVQAEELLRNDINTIWKGVEWNWFRKQGENVLYWHWSPTKEWVMNHPIKGWNEALITYVLAASSPDFAIPKIVYDAGWAQNGAIENGASYYGITLPLGPPLGGPLFFAHYSFLGINPTSLKDAYADYFVQNKAHARINYNYCIANPKGWYGYSDSCWGLTASDDHNGYSAHEPNNDLGVISPTAALSSFPYTPAESMKALHFFYYTLGDKIWKEYGFTDAFNLSIPWFANSFLAIDQGPIIVMIENHRTGLLWNLFMSAPEVKSGLRNLGFQSPHL